MRRVLSPTLAAVAVTTVGVLPVYLLGALAVQVRSELGLTRSGVGALVATFFAAAAAGSLLGGRYADRLGPTLVMRLAAALAGAALLGCALAPGTTGLAGGLVLAGLANGLGQPASNTLIARAVAASRRGLSYGAKQAAIPISILLSGLAVPVFGVTVGWRWAYVAAALVALLVAAAVPRHAPGAGSEVAPARPSAVDALRAAAAGPYRLPPLAVLAVGVLLGAGVGNAFGAFYVETAVDSGIAPATAGLWAAAGSAVGVLVRLGIGVLADSRAAPYLVVVAALMSVGALAAALLATGTPAAMLPAAVLVHGLAWAWAGLFTFAITMTHPRDPGRATGLTQGGVSLGAALGPLAFGALAETAGLSLAWLLCAGAALLAAATVLSGRALLLRERPAVLAVLSGRG